MSKATNTIWIYLDDDMKADLHKLANAERLSMSSYVRNLITKELNGGMKTQIKAIMEELTL